ncbi:MAG: ferrous iron transport protein A [Elusimicrobiota bacterium]|jgi:Fe2+ transport system protein FeoA|nr:ferrous iron transport protein A [Elusimicrobiota bacterium]
MSEMRRLSQLKEGESGILKSISSDAGVVLKKRLLDMGCVSGCQISVKKLAPLGDPIEIIIKDYSLSLRKNEAENIEVEVQ